MAEKSEVQKLKDKIEKEKQDREDLNKAIHEDRAKLRKAQQEEQNARLIQWGIALEQALSDPDSELNEKTLVKLCRKYLSDRSLSKALTGPLEEFADQGETKGGEEPRQSRQKRPQDQQSQQQQQHGQQANRPRPPQSE